MSELPDELLKDILEPAFAIPDALFRNPEGRSPFSTYVNNYKTSSLLLVNKNWCRVGTPLLYHDVILRSKAQARALAAAFKSNPDLARWVRKLRVEGGFGPSMQQILEKCGPKLTDVCLMTALYSDDSASGIVSCLSLLNPTTLVFLHSAEDRVRGNSNMDKLFAALFTTVPTWDNLRSIDCRNLREDYLRKLAEALRTGSKSVQTIIIQAESIVRQSHRTFCGLASVQEVILAFGGARYAWTTLQLQKLIEQEPAHMREKLKLKQKLEDDGGRSGREEPERRRLAAMPADPFFRPLASAPNDVARKIWAHILGYVVHTYAFTWQEKSHLLLVCKAFYNAGLPVAYEESSTTADTRTPHRKLAKIICTNQTHYDVSTDFFGLTKFFDGLDYSLYPALQEINFTSFSWPATEREIKKSKVVKVAERLLEHGVKITDCNGIPWTPRLKGVTRGTGGPKRSKA
ncbi:hypothetical protein K523DRAFT_419864 [Schizophyllum commune Tattone D]|nr:hypothetical protein K523DRAFT_419864 [Schizophyllum commune Tattone D]